MNILNAIRLESNTPIQINFDGGELSVIVSVKMIQISSIHELLYSANGLVNADDVSFLLQLAGYYIKPCDEGMYLISLGFDYP